MPQEQLHQQVQDFIITGKIKEAFVFLRTQKLDNTTTHHLNILEAEYTELRQSENKGVLSYQDIQLRKNQLNDKLLALFREDLSASNTVSKSNKSLWLLPVLLVLGGLSFWLFNQPEAYVCPDFEVEKNNKILVLPFVNVGENSAKPHILLRDRINQLSDKNNLSSIAECGSTFDDMTMRKAPKLTTQCDADLIVWGTYSSSDSIRLVLQYYFAEKPNAANLGEFLTLKDVTEIQTGSMSKVFDDALFSLCGLIALREGDMPLTEKWLRKVGNKEKIDKRILEEFENVEKIKSES
jgi:hypothetical protein